MLTVAFCDARGEAVAEAEILIVGDSISLGYKDGVVRALNGEARLTRPLIEFSGEEPNSINFARNISKWLDKNPYDVVHLNCGIWDGTGAVYAESGEIVRREPVPISKYTQNVIQIIGQALSRGAHVIWATITPVGRIDDCLCREGFEAKYNQSVIAMIEDEFSAELHSRRLLVNDLYSLVLSRGISKIDSVHCSPEGYAVLAEAVATHIRRALRDRTETDTTP